MIVDLKGFVMTEKQSSCPDMIVGVAIAELKYAVKAYARVWPRRKEYQ